MTGLKAEIYYDDWAKDAPWIVRIIYPKGQTFKTCPYKTKSMAQRYIDNYIWETRYVRWLP